MNLIKNFGSCSRLKITGTSPILMTLDSTVLRVYIWIISMMEKDGKIRNNPCNLSNEVKWKCNPFNLLPLPLMEPIKLIGGFHILKINQKHFSDQGLSWRSWSKKRKEKIFNKNKMML